MQQTEAMGPKRLSKRARDRMEAKRRTREKRARRNARILELYREGGMTQLDVAHAVGCSPRTVGYVLHDAGLTRTYRPAGRSPERKEIGG